MQNLNDYHSEMPWLLKKVKHEGFPLLIRKPDHKNFRKYQKEYYHLFCISHSLKKVTPNGLPEVEYFQSLEDFDTILIDFFSEKTEGITILVETFCGKRNYWYFIKDKINIETKFKKLCQENSEHDLSYTLKIDENWLFVKEYPLAFKGITIKFLLKILCVIGLLIIAYYLT